MDWYKNVFIPDVIKRKAGKNEKFLLLLDNAPCHPSDKKLNSINKQFKIKYLPPNVTSLIQPMNQGVIESMKRHYKQLFLQKILFEDCNSSATIVSFIKKWKLSDTIFLAVSAWDLVTQQTLSMTWKNLLGLEFIEKSSDVTEEITTLNQIHRSQTHSTSEVEEWIAQDNSLPTWNQLSLDQLIEKETTGNTDFEVIFLTV